MHCPHCQQEHPDGLKFCPLTGKALTSPTTTCWKCRRAIPANSAFCAFCGARQGGVEAVPSRQPRRQLYKGLLVGGILLMLLAGFMLVRSLRPAGTAPGPQALWDVAPASEAVQPAQDTTQLALLPTIALPATPVPPTPKPTLAPTFPPTASPPPTATEVPFPQPIDLKINPKDNAELVLVPGGPFLMGADPGSQYFWGAEAPQHEVTLDQFWIDRTEVTNAMYQLCMAEKACPRPSEGSSNTRGEYYENPAYADYPVIYVSYVHAVSYCRWAGGRLPTEAEWEKAARGDDGRMFPWGDEPASPQLANYGTRDTGAVGSYPAGASPYGAYDMAGNVLEWVFDYMQETYYRVSPDQNPRGPASGTRRVYRGGAWHNLDEALRAAARASAYPKFTSDDIGFRCAVDNP